MKRLLKIILIVCVALVVMAFGARASGDESIEYIITSEGEDYLLSRYTGSVPTPVLRSTVFADITKYISSFSSIQSSIIFGGVEIGESINFDEGSYTLSGSLTLTNDASLNIDSKNTLISQMALKMDSGYIRLKRGTLTVYNSTIEAKNNSAVILDYSAEASLLIKSGSLITSESKNAAVDVQLGSATVSGGEINNTVGYAIVNKSTLILSGTPIIDGGEYGIVSENPILLSYGTEYYSGSVSVKYLDDFEEGTVSCVFYSASENSLKNIKFYDNSGEKKELSFFEGIEGFSEKNFGGVYLPYYVNFYVDSSLVKRVEALRGKSISSESAIEKEGYEFIGWSTEYGDNLLYDFAKGVDKSFDLYANYKLKPPSFSVSSLCFDYDGKEHALSINSLEHPLLKSAILNYTWYKDENSVVGYGAEIKLKSVSESGKYSCKINFTYGTDSVSVITPEVDVIINRAVVEIPKIEDKYYNGEAQKPNVYSTSVYTVSDAGGTVVGNYPVEISLNDSENYVFSDGTEVVRVEFRILRAENYWLDEPIIYDVYEGMIPSPISSSRFGNAVYLYSDKENGVFTDSPPQDAGIFYCVAKVFATDNFEELVSSPIKFSIIEEKLTGISILSMPNVCDYTAFQKFIADGLVLSVTYNSSRTEKISADKISFSYQSADSFRYNDTAVIASYIDSSIAVPVNVEKAEYDVSGIIFSDCAFVYDGIGKTIGYKGVLPVGIDGIPLECSILGGGINAGDYKLTLTFSTKSKNYRLPQPMSATLSILPYESKVVFTEKEFVYDGTLKCPKAYYTDIYGRKIDLEVSGAYSLSGEYAANALSNDNNYKLIESSTIYTIKKATYNFENVSWTGADFVYDGTEKSVKIIGLPEGVSVIGYSDNKAVNAGVYTAKVSLLYDEKNYNPPEELSHIWTVRKADYDLSGFYFSDVTSVYNGSLHYPNFFGAMPCGADGIFLEYHFERGVLNVSEGKRAVQIVYSTKSKNYSVPESSVAYVELLPCGITVSWSDFEFTYDTSIHSPSAVANECRISVLGGRSDAGNHVATAISLDSNYYVINPTVGFVINKAVNLWTSILKIDSIFEGRNLNPSAEALAGEVYYEYYSDPLCENKIDIPTLPGVYYVVAFTSGNANYSSLKSSPTQFEIEKIIPVGISVSLSKKEFSAFDIIEGGHINLLVENNDGNFVSVDSKNASVKYQNAESLRFGDSYITVSYLGFTRDVAVSVGKAEYDMSGVKWSSSEFIYDGEVKNIILTGLPEGVGVISYSGTSAVLAGEYLAFAELSYDSHNYNKPSLPEGAFVIKKQTVIPPNVESAEYSGKEYIPIIQSSDLYTVFSIPSISAGTYYATLKLTDSSNYEFPNSSSEISLEYDIFPRKLTVQLSDVEKYLFDKQTLPSFTVTEGEIAECDTLSPIFIYEKDYVSCEIRDSNYSVTVIPGKIIKHNFLSEEDLFKVFVAILLLILIVFLILIIVLRRKEITRYVSVIKCRLSPVSKTVKPSDDYISIAEQKVDKTEECESLAEGAPDVEVALSVDRDHADSLITDSLAKDLVRKDDVRIYTEGNKKRIINVDTLSENFLSGECVDVNRLKEMSLVPYDTAYIKVLARGMIDKPLKVYANDFSLSAVKMIALTGGEAVKVVTVRKKKDGGEDSDNKIVPNT